MAKASVERSFDWRPRHDFRSRFYGIREAVIPMAPRNITWRTPVNVIDQGSEGACVGFGWTNEASTTPVAIPGLDNTYARGVYREAQRIDEWEGEDYEGTSVLAGAKVMVRRGYLREYRWAFSIDEVILALGTIGPVVLGIEWRSGMYDAPGGILGTDGYVVGGHCILAHAHRKSGSSSPFPDGEPAIGLLNSWGRSWGINGRAWIRKSDLAELLSRDGEACVPFRRSWGPK